jgi:tetratricopeptide (TPR) repeat protein
VTKADRQRRCSSCGAWLARDNPAPQCSPCQSADRGELPTSPVVPPEFWHDSELQAALAERHMGQVIRAYRHHLHHGRQALAQDDVASWAGLSQGQLSRIETGPPLHNLDRLIFWAQLLGIPEGYLWFKLPEDDVDEVSEVDRRQFLGGTAAVAAEAIGSGLWTSRLGLSGVSEFDQLRLAVERASRLERSSQYVALDVVLPGLLAESDHLMDEAAGSRQEAVSGLMSQVQALQAWLLIKRDQPAEAKAAATSAVASAQAADDVVLVGAALRCLGESHLRAGRYGLACDLAVEAAEVVRRSSTADQDALVVQGAGYLSAAMACARDGDGDSAGELLEVAGRCADELGRDMASPAVFGPSNVDIHRVAVAMDLGDAGTALEWAERTPVQLPPGYEERQARCLIDVARAYAEQQRDDDAVRTFLEAEEIAPEEVRTHRLTQLVLGDLLARERRSRTPALRPLAARCGVLA